MLALTITCAMLAEPWQANPELVDKSREGRPEFRWAEEDAAEYALPKVVGDSITRETWPDRRAEIVSVLEKEMFGRPPAELKWTVSVEERGTVERLSGEHFLVTCIATHGDKSVRFTADVVVPIERTGPVPAFVLIGHRASTNLEPPTDPNGAGYWPVELLLKRGYAAAAFHCEPIAPDRKDAHDEGVHGMFEDLGPDGWSTLAAWAWGASRVLDGLEQIDAVDAKRVGVIGHSRGGKTALWAGASDERFAIAVSNESGCGGAALSRRRMGETVARINSSFPYWFNDRFKTYDNKEDELPFDQHFVISAMAPRAVYVASADEDLWADPRGEYLAVVASNAVFGLFGDGPFDNEMPGLNEQKIVGRRGYHIRPGRHNLTAADWTYVLDFADKQWNETGE